MIRLPLYRDNDRGLPIDRIKGADINRDCEDCPLHVGTVNVCMNPEGHPGGLLVVGDYPTREEDAAGRVFYGQAGRSLRQEILKHWKGPIAFDNAVKCAPGKRELTDKSIVECSPYMRNTIDIVKPQRILAFGSVAINALLGRKLQVLTNRRAYALLEDGTPVFVFPSPAAAQRNRFVRAWLEADIEWALTVDIPSSPYDVELRIVETEEDALEAEREIIADGTMVFDVETYGPLHDRVWHKICAVAALGLNGESPWVWPMESLDNNATRIPLERLLTSPTVGKIGSNVKYDMLACRTDARFGSTWDNEADFVVGPIVGDTRVWRKMLFSDADGSLDTMANLVGMGGHKFEAKAALEEIRKSLAKHKKKHSGTPPLRGILPDALYSYLMLGGDLDVMQFAFGLMPRDVLLRYNARDTLSTAKVARRLLAELEETPHVRMVWDKISGPAIPALEQIEAWGMPVSRDNINKLGALLEVKLAQCKQRMAAHGLTDPGSNQKVAAFLYDPVKKGGLGITCTHFTDPTPGNPNGNPSVDAAALKELKDRHPAIADLLEYRKLDKLRGTYVEGMGSHIGGDDRIHPTLNLDGARSGRLSCSNPNLQNIPRAKGDPMAKMAKDVFATREGYYLLQADYSQLELRVAAMLSGDKNMIDIFQSGEDYHLRCAKIISQTAWGVHPDDVLPGGEYRSKAKNFVFGLLYGMTDGGLAQRMGCTKEEAARIRQAVLGSFPELARWIKECLAIARKTGWTYTWWAGERARQRTLYQIAGQDNGMVITMENSSFNTPCQGTASDFMLRSVVDIVDWIKEESVPAKLVITVHDSAILEVRADALEEVGYQVNRIMTSHDSAGVPLVVDQECGRAWGSLVNYRYQAVQATGNIDKKFNETHEVEPGVEAIYVRADKDAPAWLHRFDFNPVIMTKVEADRWLRTHGHNPNLVEPWV